MPTKAEGIAQSSSDFNLTRGVGTVVEITLGILIFKVDCRRNHTITNGIDTGKDFDAPPQHLRGARSSTWSN